MHEIEITLPSSINPQNLVGLYERNAKANSTFPSKICHVGFEGQENIYLISSEYPESFYEAGVFVGIILKQLQEKKTFKNGN